MCSQKKCLFLISCVMLAFACTGKQKKPLPRAADQDKDSSTEMRTMQEQMDAMQQFLNNLSSQQRGQNQPELTALRDKMNDLQKAVRDGQANQKELRELREQLKKLEDKNGASQNNETDTSQNDGNKGNKEDKTEEQEPTQDSTLPKIAVSLVEVEQDGLEESYTLIINRIKEEETRTVAPGTYVTFHSDQDVVIEKIIYGDLKRSSLGEGGNKLKIMELPVTIEFNHKGKTYCVRATTEGSQTEMTPTDEKECK